MAGPNISWQNIAQSISLPPPAYLLPSASWFCMSPAMHMHPHIHMIHQIRTPSSIAWLSSSNAHMPNVLAILAGTGVSMDNLANATLCDTFLSTFSKVWATAARLLDQTTWVSLHSPHTMHQWAMAAHNLVAGSLHFWYHCRLGTPDKSCNL